MANNFDANPWILDTAAVLTAGRIKVRKAVLRSGSDAALADFEDGNGRVCGPPLATPAADLTDEITFNPPQVFDGLELATLTGTAPKVYLYLEPNLNGVYPTPAA